MNKLTNLGFKSEEELKEEWDEIEALVLHFQAQFSNDCTEVEKKYADECGNILLARFSPLFWKYIQVIKHLIIDWTDKETKEFVALFVDDYELKKSLYRKKINAENRASAYNKFNFVTKTYGANTEEDIISDLSMCLLILAKRYKNVGKNFCAYVHNVFKHEVGRHIKKWIKDPLSINYKNHVFEDWTTAIDTEKSVVENLDNNYEMITGLPDLSWLNGQTCGKLFVSLSTFQRKILVKYYLENWNDRQIAEYFGAHINTINQRRREAINKLCNQSNYSKEQLKRSRNSGRKASLPTI